MLGSCLGLAFFGSALAESSGDSRGVADALLRPVVCFLCAGALAGLLALFDPRSGVARSLLALVTALFVLWAMDALTRPVDVLFAFVDLHSVPGFGITVAGYTVVGSTAGWTVARLARVYPYRHALGLGAPLAAPFALGAWLAVDFNPRGALFRTRSG